MVIDTNSAPFQYTDRPREGDIDPVFRVADQRPLRREPEYHNMLLPDCPAGTTAAFVFAHTPKRPEVNITIDRHRSRQVRKQKRAGSQGYRWPSHCNSFHAIKSRFPSQKACARTRSRVGTGFRVNKTRQTNKSWSPVPDFNQNRTGSKAKSLER